MKDKRLDELYQYIEEHEEKWRIDHLKRYEYENRINKAIEYIENAGLSNYEKELYEILIGDDNNAI